MCEREKEREKESNEAKTGKGVVCIVAWLVGVKPRSVKSKRNGEGACIVFWLSPG